MASKRITGIFSSLLRTPKAPSPFLSAPLLRPYPRLPRTLQPGQVVRRHAHQIPRPGRPSPPAAKDGKDDGETKTRKQLEPHYELTFTCVPCGSRSSHAISKQGYHKGSVLITCPSCRNRHVISDHLNIFGDRKVTIEDIMRERGQLVKRGTLGVDGDIEFWEDGTQTPRGAEKIGTDKSEGAAEPQAATQADEASKAREARDPTTSAASPTTTTTTQTPLGGSGSRPRLNDGHSAVDAPSTKRQFHASSEFRRNMASFVRDDELDELRAGLRGESEPEKQATNTKPQVGNGGNGFYFTKHYARDRRRGVEDDKQIPAGQSPKPEAQLRSQLTANKPLPDYEKSRVRLVASGLKFRAEHYKPKSSPASAPENSTSPPSGRRRVVYAWPEGSKEAVEVVVDHTGKVISQMPDRVRRIQRKPGTPLSFRKVAYNESEVADFATATEATSPQRPLPEETYARITRGVESARQLPPQKVALEDFDILDHDMKKAL
ncbi:hypothetical protein E8E14_011389 [Neopestalotiopsis sp. 37M]|nr:hypothetical protein E8E14_011389 [Neopestalotiopsis sp. 37M]